MTDLNALVMFAAVVESKSFSEAARRSKIPVSTVSRRIADLEEQLGVRLLERSTRNVRLTEIGAEILDQARRSVDIRDAVDAIVSYQRTSVTGVLRLSAPPSISDSLLAPLVGAFQSLHPNVRVQIFVTERHVDHVAEGIDVALRLGPLEASSLIAQRLLTYRHRLVASPTYLSTVDAPRLPRDLLKHRLLAFARTDPERSWTFAHANKRKKETATVTFLPHLAMNDYAGLATALVAGAGIGDLPPVVQPDLVRTGRLVEVMPEWRFRALDLSLVHLGGRHAARVVRVFLDFAAKMAPTLFSDLPV